MPKNATPNFLNTTSNKTNIIPERKNDTSYTPIPTNKTKPKTSSIVQSATTIVAAVADRTIVSNVSNPRIVIKAPPPLATSIATPIDNTYSANTMASHTVNNTSINLQPKIAHISNSASNNTNNNVNFGSAAATEKTPIHKQTIVFSAIDGIPQKEYILAIGKIVLPKNIIFVSRISNNRFCIFLSNKQILDNLMQTTQNININYQII